jgi:hypothetical protein
MFRQVLKQYGADALEIDGDKITAYKWKKGRYRVMWVRRTV